MRLRLFPSHNTEARLISEQYNRVLLVIFYTITALLCDPKNNVSIICFELSPRGLENKPTALSQCI